MRYSVQLTNRRNRRNGENIAWVAARGRNSACQNYKRKQAVEFSAEKALSVFVFVNEVEMKRNSARDELNSCLTSFSIKFFPPELIWKIWSIPKLSKTVQP